MTIGVRKTSDFCWINILTPDPAGAKDFFGKLLGWTFSDLDGMGDLIEVDGKQVGGMFDLNSPQTPPGTPAVIGVMVKVDNADAMAERVRSLGGKAEPPTDVGQNGRMVMCHDTSGAQIDLWQPLSKAGMSSDPSSHGAPSWFENYSTDVAKSTEFYSKLFGWKPEVMHMQGMDYTTFKLDAVEQPIAGLMALTPNMGAMPPNWATYFTVDDPDAAAVKTKELGGQVHFGPMDIPGVGRFCNIASPQGVTFFVIKYFPRQ
ncbi:MAG: VOC family protein [Gemmatimonadales bacterium]